ncbi:hypothetical protein B0H19DRAFT_1273489 [Mycena capillaripes]|nr:hypothetical protein B0H19DRAFT_1273489 [Mycena capillaripes]
MTSNEGPSSASATPLWAQLLDNTNDALALVNALYSADVDINSYGKLSSFLDTYLGEKTRSMSLTSTVDASILTADSTSSSPKLLFAPESTSSSPRESVFQHHLGRQLQEVQAQLKEVLAEAAKERADAAKERAEAVKERAEAAKERAELRAEIKEARAEVEKERERARAEVKEVQEEMRRELAEVKAERQKLLDIILAGAAGK